MAGDFGDSTGAATVEWNTGEFNTSLLNEGGPAPRAGPSPSRWPGTGSVGVMFDCYRTRAEREGGR
ncbi:MULTISPECIES: hypothetical protein [unclassified Nonomuraea]|uniref:hypothetical protein n=1 Tax=unclassified Nonomuraea TaxID=2593643 RepID=UPI0035C1F7C4